MAASMIIYIQQMFVDFVRIYNSTYNFEVQTHHYFNESTRRIFSIKLCDFLFFFFTNHDVKLIATIYSKFHLIHLSENENLFLLSLFFL